MFAGPVSYGTDETIVLNGNGEAGFGALENQSGNNTFAGTITLGSDARIGLTAGTFVSSGTLQVPAGRTLTKDGGGLMTVRGDMDFSAGSVLAIVNGTLTLTPNSPSVISLASQSPILRISGSGLVRVGATQRNPLADTVVSTRRMSVENQVSGGFVIETGNAEMGPLSGTGGTVVNSSGLLSATHIRQGALTISAAAGRATVRSDGTAPGNVGACSIEYEQRRQVRLER